MTISGTKCCPDLGPSNLVRANRAEAELRRTRVGLALYSLWVDVSRTGLDAQDISRRLLLHVHEVVEAWEGGATAVEVLMWLGELLCGDLAKDKLLRAAMTKVEDVVLGRYREDWRAGS